MKMRIVLVPAQTEKIYKNVCYIKKRVMQAYCFLRKDEARSGESARACSPIYSAQRLGMFGENAKNIILKALRKNHKITFFFQNIFELKTIM